MTRTGLKGYLKERGIDTLFFVGLATDFCVASSAIDAAHVGFTAYIIEDACKAVNYDGSLEKAWSKISAAGVKRIQSSQMDLGE